MTTQCDEITNLRTLEELRMKNARLKQERRGMQYFLSLQAEHARLREQRALIDKSGQQLMQTLALTFAVFHQKEEETAASPEVLRHLLQDVSGIKAAMQGILTRPSSTDATPTADQKKTVGQAVSAGQSGAIGDVLKASSTPAFVQGQNEVGKNTLIFLDEVAYVPEPDAPEHESADSWSSSSDPEAECMPTKSISSKFVGHRLRSVSSLSTVCSLVEREGGLVA